jgi:hypothetical protein
MRRSKPLSACAVSLFACLALCLVPHCVAGADEHPQPAPSSVSCANCHEAQARTQPDTFMGRALALPGGNPVLDAHPDLVVHKGDYTYTVETRNGHSTYSVSNGSDTLSAPILWSFGAGNQTWLVERSGRFYESLVSYYASIDGLDTTTGDATIAPATIDQAFGRELDPIDTRACFGCHSTNSTVDGRLALATLHPGIACDRCHADSLEHQASMVSGDLTRYPPDLRRLSPEDLSTLCGQCHRTWEMVVRSHWRGEANVRFQPYRLANSRCFDGNDPRISCITCHDPHQPLVRDLAFYDAKCLACHNLATHSSSERTVRHDANATQKVFGASSSEAKSCPVAGSKCVTCHMPRTRMLGGHLIFTDHEIRVVHPGDAYPD